LPARSAMIQYRRGAVNIFFRVTQLKGSVFPVAACIALPCAAASYVLKWVMEEGYAPFLTRFEEKSVIKATSVWSSFTFLVGFLIVFRTSQAYARFWDGCRYLHQMRAEWFDACSSLVAFCRHTRRSFEEVQRFEHILVRMFSMLHAVALAEIEDSNSDNVENVAAFKYELVDVASLDPETLRVIKDSDSRVELVFQWIQQLVVENIARGIVSIPPPLLSRTFQELANGMCQFHEAIKVSTVPFPFPYAQTCDCLLLVHFLVTPLIITQFCTDPLWAALFSFVQIFIHWALNLTAVELENPYGFDPNDIDAEAMQLELNRHLLLLLSPVAKRIPTLSEEWSPDRHERLQKSVPTMCSLAEVWVSILESNDLYDQVSAQRTYRAKRFTSSREHLLDLGNQQDCEDQEQCLEQGWSSVRSDGSKMSKASRRTLRGAPCRGAAGRRLKSTAANIVAEEAHQGRATPDGPLDARLPESEVQKMSSDDREAYFTQMMYQHPELEYSRPDYEDMEGMCIDGPAHRPSHAIFKVQDEEEDMLRPADGAALQGRSGAGTTDSAMQPRSRWAAGARAAAAARQFDSRGADGGGSTSSSGPPGRDARQVDVSPWDTPLCRSALPPNGGDPARGTKYVRQGTPTPGHLALPARASRQRSPGKSPSTLPEATGAKEPPQVSNL